MARQIDGARNLWQRGPDYGTDAKRLANIIATASLSLSQSVVKMMSDLKSFVSYLENMRVKKERSMLQRILGYVELFFKALAGIVGLGSYIAPYLCPGVAAMAPAASALCMAVAELCKKAAGMSLGMPAGTNE
jgi:hypothetical protein